mgnify:CR=1 FL=1
MPSPIVIIPNDEDRQNFKEACHKVGRSMNRVLQEFIKQFIAQHNADDKAFLDTSNRLVRESVKAIRVEAKKDLEEK